MNSQAATGGEKEEYFEKTQALIAAMLQASSIPGNQRYLAAFGFLPRDFLFLFMPGLLKYMIDGTALLINSIDIEILQSGIKPSRRRICCQREYEPRFLRDHPLAKAEIDIWVPG